jgi:hypothetical protein
VEETDIVNQEGWFITREDVKFSKNRKRKMKPQTR